MKIKKGYDLKIVVITLSVITIFSTLLYASSFLKEVLRVPMLEDKRIIEIKALIRGDELIRPVHGDPRFSTYIVADQLYSLIDTREGDAMGTAVPPGGYPLDSPDTLRISGLLKLAVSAKLPGASILQEVYTKGDVIILKASDIAEPIEIGVDEDENPITEEEEIISSMWHEKMHLAMHRLEPDLFKRICNIVANSNSEMVSECRQIVKEEYLFEDGSLGNSTEVIVYILTEVVDPEKIVRFVNDFFPPELTEVVMDIWNVTRPSGEEITEIRKVAQGIFPYIDELSYVSVIKDCLEGKDASVKETISTFIGKKLLSQAL